MICQGWAPRGEWKKKKGLPVPAQMGPKLRCADPVRLQPLVALSLPLELADLTGEFIFTPRMPTPKKILSFVFGVRTLPLTFFRET